MVNQVKGLESLIKRRKEVAREYKGRVKRELEWWLLVFLGLEGKSWRTTHSPDGHTAASQFTSSLAFRTALPKPIVH